MAAVIPKRLIALSDHAQEAAGKGLLALLAAKGRFTKELTVGVNVDATPGPAMVGGGLSAVLRDLGSGEYLYIVCSPDAVALLGLADFPVSEIDISEALDGGEG